MSLPPPRATRTDTLFPYPTLFRSNGSRRDWNNLAENCFRLIDDKWITIQIRLRFGPWQADAKKGDPRLSHVSIWGAIEGEHGGRQRLVIDNDFYASSPVSPENRVGQIWLMPHLYEENPREAHPPFFVGYDRKSVGSGKSVSVRVDLCGRRNL